MSRVISVGRGFYNHAYPEGESGHACSLGDIKVSHHYVRIPVTPASVRALYQMADYYAAADGDETPPATKGYARKLRDKLERDYGEFLA